MYQTDLAAAIKCWPWSWAWLVN